VAAHLRVTHQAGYKWVAHFGMRRSLDLAARRTPGQHCGRPRTVHGIMDPLILEVRDHAPRARGIARPSGRPCCCAIICGRFTMSPSPGPA
jgi:hypothetical protein